MLIIGENVESRCDYIVASEKSFSFNPTMVSNTAIKSKWIRVPDDTYVENHDPVQNKPGSHVFAFPHEFFTDACMKILQLFQQPFHLVLHNSDVPFSPQFTHILAHIPNIQNIYTSNCAILGHPRVFPIPLGFQNRQWWSTENDLQFIEDTKAAVESGAVPKDHLVFFNFSIRTNPTDRQTCHDILVKKGFTWNSPLPYMEYIPFLARHRFCICPVGNGIDTHRFWEALALHVIPVCLHNPVTDFYAQFLPVVVLNAWEELSVEMLEGVQGADWSNLDTIITSAFLL